MLQKYIEILHMLQEFQRYVASVHSKCFICFKRMLQVFYMDVAHVSVAIHIFYKRLFKCFICFKRILQVFNMDVA
jgi:hypothetical protein